MTIVVNGDRRVIPDGLSLAGLLEHLGLDPRMIVVEYNRAIVRRPNLAEVLLSPDDVVELVHFVGGG
ncbi:MAG: sulfur carrier protein ThiS [Gemmatimonadota bacterium]